MDMLLDNTLHVLTENKPLQEARSALASIAVGPGAGTEAHKRLIAAYDAAKKASRGGGDEGVLQSIFQEPIEVTSTVEATLPRTCVIFLFQNGFYSVFFFAAGARYRRVSQDSAHERVRNIDQTVQC